MVISIDDETGLCRLNHSELGTTTHFTSIRNPQTGEVTITITVDTSQPTQDGKTRQGDDIGGIGIAGIG